MKTLIITIGVIVFSLAMYSIPILIACSFCLDWNDKAKFMLVSFGVLQLSTLCCCLHGEVEK